MLRDEKWIVYAVRVLRAVDGGANTTARIANEIEGSATYLAKVIAVLRKGGLLTEQTELARGLDQITIADLAILADPRTWDNPINSYIVKQVLISLAGLSVKQLILNVN